MTVSSLSQAVAEAARIVSAPDAWPGAAGAANGDALGRIAAHWIPAARARRDAAAASSEDHIRWERLLSDAAPTQGSSPGTAQGRATAIHALLAALADTSPTPAEIGALITTGIRNGRYQPGVSLAAPVIAAELRVPVRAVKTAIAELAATGVLDRSGKRTAVPVTGDEAAERGRYLALRLRAQMAYGLYPPGSTLPTGLEIGRHFVTNDPVVRTALGLLVDEGLIQRRPARPPLVLDAAGHLTPTGCAAPPPDQVAELRFTSVQIRTAVAAAYAKWQQRSYLPADNVIREWQQLRAMTRQLLERQPQSHRASPSPRAVSAARARETESATLPKTTLLALWHTACLASSAGDLL
ncbi:GntR family transcriptional regulator [Streptomyces sp. NPDC001553]|uniref:GntR family transcriptional regulator n=1 Tax=Streptomyces sp. NPDC001553 TaxID=3154385 RepID=UPI00332AF8B8